MTASWCIYISDVFVFYSGRLPLVGSTVAGEQWQGALEERPPPDLQEQSGGGRRASSQNASSARVVRSRRVEIRVGWGRRRRDLAVVMYSSLDLATRVLVTL
ncbi:hypothetical protein PM082_020647 [Marasmius tenuissimus]|nr:hypothetical protein PM082_020647 [Marasmius tenuissimus]